MHHNVLLLAAGLICTPIFAAPNANNRLNPRKVHRHRQAPKPAVTVGTPYKPPTYGPPPGEVTVAADPTDSTSVLVDPIGASTTSACSVVRITEYVTVYGTSPPASSSTLGNFTSPPYGWNSSVGISSFLTGTGTGAVLPTSASANITSSAAAANVTTSQPYFPISNSTTSDLPYATTGGQHQHNETSAVLPTFINETSAVLPTFVNVTTTVNVTVFPTSTFLAPSNFTSFPNISTPDVTPTPIPTSSAVVSANFTSFANITSTPEISFSILPIPASTSFANITSTPEISFSILPIPATTSLSNFTSFANVSSSTAFFPNSSVPATTTAEEPTSSSGLTVTSFIIPTLTTDIIPGESVSSTVITSLVIATTMTPIDVATSSSTSTVTTLVIATTLSPIDTASVSLSDLPTTVVVPTATVSSADAPTGTPNPEDIHCGIKGEAIGTYYLATYAYNKANVPVTLQGCFQFCSFAVEQCFSFEFYLEPGLGAPRCKLYGGPVAFEVESIDPFQPYTWYDLACGDPTK
ncbi:hypothetical protein Daus18300_002033 [Diaporthe australafricana]|uniref:Apple domain-containing protein n=1 Tax=Diaporthe australafricana TaxID=127596 RepID=A0ABR3XTA2_9PEZI